VDWPLVGKVVDVECRRRAQRPPVAFAFANGIPAVEVSRSPAVVVGWCVWVVCERDGQEACTSAVGVVVVDCDGKAGLAAVAEARNGCNHRLVKPISVLIRGPNAEPVGVVCCADLQACPGGDGLPA